MAALEFISIFCMIDDDDEDEDYSDRNCLKDRRTPRTALCQHRQSAFIYLFNPGNEQALLNCCGVDHKVFRDLLDLFEPVFDIYTIDKKRAYPQANLNKEWSTKGKKTRGKCNMLSWASPFFGFAQEDLLQESLQRLLDLHLLSCTNG
eukprot:jgi/Psemu1/29791/gm1.29791_g